MELDKTELEQIENTIHSENLHFTTFGKWMVYISCSIYTS